MIRPARRSDFDALLRLVAAYYRFDSIRFNRSTTGRALRRLLREESLGRVWVIDAGGALAGYAVLTYNFDMEFGGVQGIVTDFFIAARYRRKGLGARTLAAIRDYCKSRGIGTLELQVTRHNRAAQAFYRALGFKTLDRIVMDLDV
ncbi:MAG TPA: GNAT family N-acetyltransferase [Candidatus Acidoferrales bacterium]|nr:GNAT family N-acetyltransferase [Candidatus Acidoferrales bacterium]